MEIIYKYIVSGRVQSFLFIIIIFSVLLYACNDDTVSTEIENHPPIAYAGEDIRVLPDEEANITGEASDPDGDFLMYEWNLIGQPANSDPVISEDGLQFQMIPDLLRQVQTLREPG